MMRRFLVVLVGLAGVAGAAETRPNIILMMGDDHGWEETGYNGHPHLKTPVLDGMAATGVRFDHFYAAHPSCSPTRASVLTGRHPNRMGTFAPGWSLRPEEITLAHLLAEVGYRCAHFGKWHVGAVKRDSPLSPLAMGYHECLAHDNFFELNPPLSRDGGEPEIHTGESSAILVEEAIRFLDRAAQEGQPFFATIWFGSPHEPYQGLSEDLELYEDMPGRYPDKQVRLTSNETGLPVTRRQGEVLQERYAEITAMDRAIGTLRRHLARQGLRQNTLVFYCGDNGTSVDGLLQSPHRGAKGDFYEGGVRVPGLLEWPARFHKPTRIGLRASTSDLLPTLAALAGATPPARPLDGVDLMPLISLGLTERPTPLFFWGFDHRHFLQRSPEPYLDPLLQQGTTPLVKLSQGRDTRDFLNYRHPGEITEADYQGPRAIIKGKHKLLIDAGKPAAEGRPRYELYDLEADPGETHDLAKEQPELVETLSQRLLDWQDSVLRSLKGADYPE